VDPVIEDTFFVECPICGDVSEYTSGHPREFVRGLTREEILARALRGDGAYEWTCLACRNKRSAEKV
jgi:hypothetical protein